MDGADGRGDPRYTGRQVWNRQFTDHREAVPGDKRSSLGPARVWNPRSDWVFSEQRTHPALVSDENFTLAQEITALGRPEDGQTRRYALTGLLLCEVCGRRLVAHWNRKPAYRCRHGHTSAHPAQTGPRWVYWTQERLFRQLQEANKDLAHLGDADELAAYLKANDLIVVCGPGTFALEPAAGEPEGVVEPLENAVDLDQPEFNGGGVQLEIPMPTAHRRRDRRLQRRWTLRPDTTGKQKTPPGLTPKRE